MKRRPKENHVCLKCRGTVTMKRIAEDEYECPVCKRTHKRGGYGRAPRKVY